MVDRNREREELRRRDQERRREQQRHLQHEREQQRKAIATARKKQQDEIKRKLKAQRDQARKAARLAAKNAPKKASAFVGFFKQVFSGSKRAERLAIRAERRAKLHLQSSIHAPSPTVPTTGNTIVGDGQRLQSPDINSAKKDATAPTPLDKGFL